MITIKQHLVSNTNIRKDLKQFLHIKTITQGYSFHKWQELVYCVLINKTLLKNVIINFQNYPVFMIVVNLVIPSIYANVHVYHGKMKYRDCEEKAHKWYPPLRKYNNSSISLLERNGCTNFSSDLELAKTTKAHSQNIYWGHKLFFFKYSKNLLIIFHYKIWPKHNRQKLSAFPSMTNSYVISSNICAK